MGPPRVVLRGTSRAATTPDPSPRVWERRSDEKGPLQQPRTHPHPLSLPPCTLSLSPPHSLPTLLSFCSSLALSLNSSLSVPSSLSPCTLSLSLSLPPALHKILSLLQTHTKLSLPVDRPASEASPLAAGVVTTPPALAEKRDETRDVTSGAAQTALGGAAGRDEPASETAQRDEPAAGASLLAWGVGAHAAFEVDHQFDHQTASGGAGWDGPASETAPRDEPASGSAPGEEMAQRDEPASGGVGQVTSLTLASDVAGHLMRRYQSSPLDSGVGWDEPASEMAPGDEPVSEMAQRDEPRALMQRHQSSPLASRVHGPASGASERDGPASEMVPRGGRSASGGAGQVTSLTQFYHQTKLRCAPESDTLNPEP